MAAFDTNPDKIDRVYAGVKCHNFDKLSEVVRNEGISIAIITVPASEAKRIAEALVMVGIKGILNFTPQPLNVPDQVYLQEYDMITSLEKVAYFAKQK